MPFKLPANKPYWSISIQLLLIVFLSVFYGIGSFAIAQTPVFRNYSTSQGLPSTNVYHGIQDSKGYLWWATDGGVCRFDGHNFQTFTTLDGLPDNSVFWLFEDANERIWFAPFNLELAYFENGNITRYRYNDEIIKYATPYQVPSFLHLTEDQTLYIGVHEAGIIEVDSNGRSTLITETITNRTALATQIEGVTYSVFAMGATSALDYHIALFDIAKRCHTEETRIPEPLSVRPNVVHRKNGDYLFSGRKRLVSWDGASEVKTWEFDDLVLEIYEDRQGGTWVSVRNDGVYHFSAQDIEIDDADRYFDGLTITYILEDHEHGVWFCTEGSGLYHVPSFGVRHYTQEDGLSGNRVTSIVSGHKGQVFVGYNNGNIDAIDPKGVEKITSIFGEAEIPVPAEINALVFDKTSNQLVVASASSLNIVNPSTSATQKVHDDGEPLGLRYLFRDTNLTYWSSGSKGVIQLSDSLRIQKVIEGQPHLLHSRAQRRINCMSRGLANNLLLGTYFGLFEIIEDSVRSLQSFHPFFESRITDLLKTKDGIYIASRSKGIAFWNELGVVVFNTKNKLSTNQVNDIEQMSDGSVWLATNTGLYKLKYIDNLEVDFEHFGEGRGLPINEVNRLAINDKDVWMGTNSGVVQLIGEEQFEIQVPPPVHIKSIKIGHRDTAILPKYQLAHHQNYVQVEFSAIGFRNIDGMKYAYRMLGIDSTWQTTGERSVQYPALPPENYTFQVKAIDEFGSLSEKPAAFTLELAPPWWQVWWVKGLGSLFILVVFIVLFWYRLKLIKRREAERHAIAQQISNMRLKLLRAQMNPHFTFNAINSILDFISKNDKENARTHLSKFAKLLRHTLENTEKNRISLAEEIEAIKLYLELEQSRFGKKLHYQITLEENINPEVESIPTMLVQPIVENAILHGIVPKSSPGLVKIHFKKTERSISVSIEDNGVGRKASEASKKKSQYTHRSMGTGILSERLHLLNKSAPGLINLRVTDLEDEKHFPLGTHVEIKIITNRPINHASNTLHNS